MDLYRAGGVEEYWVVNLFTEEIILYFFEDRAINNMMSL
jgi:Uma2 family endonuclease